MFDSKEFTLPELLKEDNWKKVGCHPAYWTKASVTVSGSIHTLVQPGSCRKDRDATSSLLDRVKNCTGFAMEIICYIMHVSKTINN